MAAPETAPDLAALCPAWRASLAEQRAALKARFESGTLSASRLLGAHRTVVDRILRTAWRELGMPREAALAAAGGYGRGELFPHSDIDLLVLVPEQAAGRAARALESFVSALWDIGLEVGHSVRTVEECVTLAADDVTIRTNLLETRHLAGSRALFDAFRKAFVASIDAPSFLKAKQLEQQQRHARYQVTNLEPNVKETAGGLRDLHQILWIAKAGGIGGSWAALVSSGVITRAEATALRRDESFLQDVRVRLHYQAGRREERLIFDVQTALAQAMGFRDTAHRRASEHLMQRFYRTAKQVIQINAVVLQNLGARIFPARTPQVAPINERFRARNELLEAADENLFRKHPQAILEAFCLLQQHGELKGMTAGTLRALWRARGTIGPAFRRDPVNRQQFLALLRSPRRVMREIMRMNHYGILGRYVPAFGRIEGQMQHDLYHVYTVDEHILRVMRNLRRFARAEFAHEFPLCSRLASDFDQPELLYLAGLFHDIAKGRGGDHSALGRVDALRFCRAHGLPAEDCELVAWLVENHLVMSATAQKQDLSDPGVVRAFAGRVGTERRLIALYLLTVADIRGTSPKVWNAWKGKLLEDLFWLTRRLLAGETQPLASNLQLRQETARAKLRLYTVPEGAEERLWAQLDTPYFLRHDAEEIAWHTRLLNYRPNTPDPVVKARLSPAGEGVQVMVYVRDQKDLFARICGFFERMSYSIVEAKIYTTRHGFALDSFQVYDPNDRHPPYRDVITYIEFELAGRLRTQAPLEPPRATRVSRQLRHFPLTPEVSILPDERGAHKVLSVVAGDRPGLLSRIARCLVDYGINLYTAKINTLGDRAEDVFLINGEALNDPKTVVRFESDLLEALAP